MTIETELALEWWRSSGPRTMARLDHLVDHWLDQRGVSDPGQREYTHAEARSSVREWEAS